MDTRQPVDISIPGRKPLFVKMKWVGGREPVLSGDDSKFIIEVKNTDSQHPARGTLFLHWYYVPPFEGLKVNSIHQLSFDVQAGKTVTLQVPNEWLLSEGKGYYLLEQCSIVGLEPNSTIPLNHPLCSFSVLERYAYKANRVSARVALLLAVVAILVSALATALSLFK